MQRTARFRLRTLGAVELTGPDADACARVMAQPKRLALLAFLSARRPGEPVSRDRIVATFWPELSAERARANARIALHYLRRALGAAAIVSRGHSVAVSRDALECDAAALLDDGGGSGADPATSSSGRGAVPSTASESGGRFRSAAPDRAGAGRASPKALLDLYRGEFLDALHVSGAPDFERWVDRTRAALRARASDLAWGLSDGAERSGEWISAASHARRAVDLSVDVEGATQRLIRLLDRAGDRAAAVAEYERLAAWLHGEFGIAPSPETSALIEAVRARAVSAAAAVSRPGSGSASGRRSLAVLPFEDRGGAADAGLAAGLVEDLLTALSRIRGVRVLSRTSVRRFETSPPSSMREVRELLDVDLVVEGSVRLSGGRVRITVQLIDAARDEHVWAQSYDRRLTDVFEIQSDVALRIARELEAELSPREHDRLRRAPTASLRAWQLHLRGHQKLRGRDPATARQAAELFRQALELDARFAAAWAGLADSNLVSAATGSGSVAEAVALAKQAVERALDCDAGLGEAWASLGLIHTFFECDRSAAGREYRRAVELSPGYATAHQWYGNWLCGYGFEGEGLAELAAAVDLDPLAPAIADSVALALYHVGRPAEAEAQCRRTIELDPEFWRSHLTLALCRHSRGNAEGAAAALVDLWAGGGYGATAAEARAAARLRPRDPDATFELLLEGTRSRLPDVAAVRIIEIILLMMLGRHDDAMAAVETARRDRSLGLALQFAPVLDPLADRDRFIDIMGDIGLLLPRWHRR